MKQGMAIRDCRIEYASEDEPRDVRRIALIFQNACHLVVRHEDGQATVQLGNRVGAVRLGASGELSDLERAVNILRLYMPERAVG